jgi:dipeptidyl aminopeptidase/acylaminoacyl peptidase
VDRLHVRGRYDALHDVEHARVPARGRRPRKPFRKLGTSFDGNVGLGFWSTDSATIYFNEGIRATRQLMALDVKSGNVRQVTSEQAALGVDRDDDSGALLITYADPKTPPTHLHGGRCRERRRARVVAAADRSEPAGQAVRLGAAEEITWTSKDGTKVGGVLVRPVGYQQGQRYPLIVAIHGGPASADVLGFNGGYGSQVYAGAGYAGPQAQLPRLDQLRPQAQDRHRRQLLLAGVRRHHDRRRSPDRAGARRRATAWASSAGARAATGRTGSLTHTDRFKAISSGAGTSNWISMYAQSDVQRNRQFYLGDKLPYDDFDAYWNQSPLKYIRNAKTPTMIHVVEGDPRVPSPQSVELHMALKQIGVPTELFMYPGNTHGIPDPRNQLVKSVSEMAWMDYYVRGIGNKFSWRDVLKTLESEATAATTSAQQ